MKRKTRAAEVHLSREIEMKKAASPEIKRRQQTGRDGRYKVQSNKTGKKERRASKDGGGRNE